MTKRRFKLSMAALGLLAAFFMALIALLLAPTLASANKDGGTHRHGGMSDPGYPHGGPGGAPQTFAENSNEPGDGQGNALDAPFCVDGGVYPCVPGDGGDGFDGVGGYSDSFENGYGGGGNPQGGNGSSNGNGRFSPSFWSGGPAGGGAGGGYGGGPNGNGGGPGDNGDAGNGPSDEKCGNTDKDQSDNSEQDGDETKSCDTGPEVPLLTLTVPEDDGQPSDFVDPTFGDDEPKTEDDPKGENPPITEIAVTEVPEPLTLSLFAVGLAGAAQLRRRVRKA